MYEITVEGRFCATHALRLANGTREPVHGHDWIVAVRLMREVLDESGFVADFDDVRGALDKLTHQLHHTHLNDHPWFCEINPSAENVAGRIFAGLVVSADWGVSLKSVSVDESPGCRATYIGS